MQPPLDSLVQRTDMVLRNAVDRVRDTHAEHRANIPLLTRLTAHLGIIALVILGLLLSGIEIRAATSSDSANQGTANDLPAPELNNQGDSGHITIAAVPFTIIPKRNNNRTDVVQYNVQPGDTVSGIAQQFHISADSVLWANDKLQDNPDLLSVGQTLYIPPVSGVLMVVTKGDFIQAIAARYKADVQDILNDPFNQSNHDFKSNPPQLTEGQFLMVPGGEKPFTARKVLYSSTTPNGAARGTSNFIWPTTACVSQYFWTRHPGIDLATPKGTPVTAADSGYVETVGWDTTGYGNMILVNHGNGFVTRYAHLSEWYVTPGQSVKKGAMIGRVGSTGHSTGPHLHFEVIKNGLHQNPLFFVAARAPAKCSSLR